MAIVKPQGSVARGGKGKKGVVPVVHTKYTLGIKSSHIYKKRRGETPDGNSRIAKGSYILACAPNNKFGP